jgi:hypothetical protein
MARKKLLSEKDRHIGRAFSAARGRANKKGVPFDITLEYLRKMTPDTCPVFHTVFEWGPSGLGFGKFKPNSPQLDRIIPELGYVQGNVAFISHRANRIKDNGTMEEHYAIADWIWESTHVKTGSATSVSERDYQKSLHDAKFGAILTARARQDRNDSDDHRRANEWEDSYYCAEESGGDGVGYGIEEMGTLTEADYFKALGLAAAEVICLTNAIGYFYRKFRECRMADGAESELPESCDRRVEQIQRLRDKAIQSLKKTSQDLYSEVDPDWNADTTGAR